MQKKIKIIDLSVSVHNNSFDLQPPEIKFIGHKKGAYLLGLAALFSKKFSFKRLFLYFLGRNRITPKDFPDNLGLAWENVKMNTHTGTHLDSPYHFGPVCEGKPSKTIDEIPLDWCYSDGVVLDLRGKEPGSIITKDDIQYAFKKINYKIKERDIVLIMTGASRYLKTKDYFSIHPGLSKEGLFYLLKQGVKIIGTDALGLDKPFEAMLADYLQTKDKEHLWPAHLAGRTKEYCHIEKLTNLDKIPIPYGFKVACFPVKIKGASAAWCRAVAIVEEG